MNGLFGSTEIGFCRHAFNETTKADYRKRLTNWFSALKFTCTENVFSVKFLSFYILLLLSLFWFSNAFGPFEAFDVIVVNGKDDSHGLIYLNGLQVFEPIFSKVVLLASMANLIMNSSDEMIFILFPLLLLFNNKYYIFISFMHIYFPLCQMETEWRIKNKKKLS